MKINISTDAETDGKIIQSVNTEFEGVMTNLIRVVVDTQEEQVRNALIAIGWIPPKTGGES